MKSSRRDALKALGVTAAVATFGGAGALARASGSTGVAAKPGAAGTKGKKPDTFAGLEGARFAGSTVDTVGAVEHGAVPVNFVDAWGKKFTVDVLRYDSASPGVARAGTLAVYMKVGAGRQGHKATHERHGLAAMALAAELRRRQEIGAKVPSLYTLNERAAARKAWNQRGPLETVVS